jgi:hypothetical protein
LGRFNPENDGWLLEHEQELAQGIAFHLSPNFSRSCISISKGDTSMRRSVFYLVLALSCLCGSGLMVGSVAAQTCVSTIEGSVFLDANQSGARDPGEVGLSGFAVRLYNSSWGYVGETLTGRVSAAQGRYVFPVVQTDQTYFVCISRPGGDWSETHPAAVGGSKVLNLGPHNPDTSGSPDEGRYCWEVMAGSPNRSFGMFQCQCE